MNDIQAKKVSMQPNGFLVISSLNLLIPALTCYRIKYYYLSYLYIITALTSAAYHATKIPHILYIDNINAQVAHLASLYVIFPAIKTLLPYYSIWVSYTLFVYYYGYLNNTMIWDPDLDKATPWHMSLHFLISIISSYILHSAHVISLNNLL
jgi:hypothetical protein